MDFLTQSKNQLRALSLMSLLSLCFASVLHAQPFTTFDARSMGMGGSSVASSKLANAAYSNPAMVSQPVGDDNFQLLLPIIGFNAADSQGLLDDIDAFNKAFDAADAVTATSILAQSLGKPLTIHAYGGGALGFAVGKFSMVFLYNKQYLFDLRTKQNASFLDAELQARGIEFTEVGVAIPLYTGDNIKFGITPKIVNVNSYDYLELLIDVAGNSSLVSRNSGKVSHGSNINIDLGSAYDFKNGFVAGVVLRNLNSKEFTTKLGNKIKLASLTRVGFAYNGDLFSIAADMDLNENTAIAFAEKNKFITIGVELNLFDWVAIRVGHQENTASKTNQSMNSLGLGFTPFGIGLDVAIMKNEHALSGAAQLSFSF